MLLMIVSDGEVYKHHAKLETLKEYHYSVREVCIEKLTELR